MKSLFLLIFMVLFTQYAFADCGKWTQEDSRTQGGSFIWFPGKAIATDMDVALSLAQGRALDYMSNECGAVPHGTRFVERCIEETESGYKVFTRASTTQSWCSTAKKYPSKTLTLKLNSYLTKQADDRMDVRICNDSNFFHCLEEAALAERRGDLPLASAYFAVACRNLEATSCAFLGIMRFRLGDKDGARVAFKKACGLDSDYGCDALDEFDRGIL